MHNRVPGLRSGGLMRCLITSALALLLSGCASLGSWAWPWERDAAPPALPLPSLSNHLQMISAILDGDAERRQQLWFIHGPREQPAHERLYKAVLRSVPGPPGHNPVLADQQLQQIAADPEHTLYTPNAEQVQMWQEAAAPLTDEWKKTISDMGMDPDPMLNGLIDALKKYDSYYGDQ